MSLHIDPSQWRLKTDGGIPYKLLKQTLVYEEEFASAQQEIVVEADQVTAFVLESFPLIPSFINVVSYPPRRRLPGAPAFRTKRIQAETFGSDLPFDPFGFDPEGAGLAPPGTYEQFAKLTIDYSTNPANDSDPNPNEPRTYLEITCSGAGDYATFSPRSAEWEKYGTETANVPVKEPNLPFGVPVPTTEWNIRWSQIPFEFFDATLMPRLRSKLGNVNDAVFPLLYDAPPETVMFAAYNYREQWTWRAGRQSNPPIELEIVLAEKNLISPEGVQVTHNHFLRSFKDAPTGGAETKAGWRRLLVDTGGGLRPPHPSTDLNQLFTA